MYEMQNTALETMESFSWKVQLFVHHLYISLLLCWILQEFLKAAGPVIQSPTNGAFIDSCLVHCQSLSTTSWTQFRVDNQTVGDTFYAWLTGSTDTYKPKAVDCAYPCNPTCTKQKYMLLLLLTVKLPCSLCIAFNFMFICSYI